MTRRKVAVLGATGTVGQRFIALLANHPWFELCALTTSDAKAGKRFGDAVAWRYGSDLPEGVAHMTLEPTSDRIDAEICFTALPSDAAEQWERTLAASGRHVFSNVKTHRMDPDVPLLLAEANADHAQALEKQRRERGWSGSIDAYGNCSAIHQSLALAPLQRDFGLESVVVTTIQAVSGAGYPGVSSLDAIDNVVPFIREEEEKMAEETRKFLGRWNGDAFEPADFPVSASCNRVGVREGHMEAVSVSLRGSPSPSDVADSMRRFRGAPQELGLPTAPERPIVVRDEPARPQPLLDRDAERGMASVVGRIREDPVLGTKFMVLGHNTIRGAAGASVLNAELLVAEGLI